MGLLGFVKPLYIHNFFKKKTGKHQFKLMFAAVLILSGFFLELFFSLESMWLRIAAVIGFIVLLKGSLVLNKKAGKKISDYLSKLPIFYFRLIAAVFFIVGFVFWNFL